MVEGFNFVRLKVAATVLSDAEAEKVTTPERDPKKEVKTALPKPFPLGVDKDEPVATPITPCASLLPAFPTGADSYQD